MLVTLGQTSFHFPGMELDQISSQPKDHDMKMRDALIGAVASLTVTVLGKLVVFYATKEPDQKKDRETSLLIFSSCSIHRRITKHCFQHTYAVKFRRCCGKKCYPWNFCSVFRNTRLLDQRAEWVERHQQVTLSKAFTNRNTKCTSKRRNRNQPSANISGEGKDKHKERCDHWRRMKLNWG